MRVLARLPGPEVTVFGNGVSITSGDTTASLADGTDFGTTNVGCTLVRTYTIDNRGSATLYLTGNPLITLSGSHDFSVAVQPTATVAIGSIRLAVFLVGLAALLNFLFWRPEVAGAAGRSFLPLPRPHLAGLGHGVFVGLRLVLMVSFVNLFLLSTPPGDCGEAVTFLVYPLRKVARGVAAVPLVVMIALRFIPLVVAEGNRILAAQRSRGMTVERRLSGRIRELRPLIVPLFRSVLRRADELSVALEVRCFDPYRFRRSAFGRRFGWTDASALVCSACVLGLVRLVG